MAMIDKRVSPVTTRCNWCFRIITRGRWAAERRRRQAGGYSDVICKRCLEFYFGGLAPQGLTLADPR
jgi:hypothetical protein